MDRLRASRASPAPPPSWTGCEPRVPRPRPAPPPRRAQALSSRAPAVCKRYSDFAELRAACAFHDRMWLLAHRTQARAPPPTRRAPARGPRRRRLPRLARQHSPTRRAAPRRGFTGLRGAAVGRRGRADRRPRAGAAAAAPAQALGGKCLGQGPHLRPLARAAPRGRRHRRPAARRVAGARRADGAGARRAGGARARGFHSTFFPELLYNGRWCKSAWWACRASSSPSRTVRSGAP
jgi:hypothetical protein